MKIRIAIIVLFTLTVTNAFGMNSSLTEPQLDTLNIKCNILNQPTNSSPVFLYKEKWWKKALKIVGKDLAGGLAGFVTGSVTPGLGNGVGLIVGGAASSIQAAGGVLNPGSDSGNSVKNTNNKYDFAGELHIKILTIGLDEKNEKSLRPKGQLNHAAFLQFARELLIHNDVYTEKDLSTYGIKELSNDLQFVLETDNLSLVELSEKLSKAGRITDRESAILELYFSEMNTINSINSFKQFVKFSIELENVISDSNFPESSKQLLLSMCATTRHDLNFWIQNGHLLK